MGIGYRSEGHIYYAKTPYQGVGDGATNLRYEECHTSHTSVLILLLNGSSICLNV